MGARGAAAEQSFFNGDPFSEERPPVVDDATYFRKREWGILCVGRRARPTPKDPLSQRAMTGDAEVQ